ncbi:MAG: hypothetical protein QG551_139 [Patescibacteria group bacterium]|jgi:hypothetical protein|nr:hypothetical protein [Patescibacteria group bacterium]
MKTAPLVIILLIGLGILGYIFVNKQNETDINTNDEFSSFEEENDAPITPNNNTGAQTNTNTTNKPNTYKSTSDNNTVNTPSNPPVAQGGTPCAPGDMPWINIISPNNSAIFSTNHSINIQWESCNISNEPVHIILVQGPVEGEYQEGPGGFVALLKESTENDGNELTSLSNVEFNGESGLTSGRSNFRVAVMQGPYFGDPSSIFGISDNFFTIN